VDIILIILVLVALLAFSAFFSGSETALMSISRLRLRYLAESKPGKAGLVERILQRPERLIGTILLGNNLVNVAMSAIATALAMSFWGNKGIAYVTVVLTIAILVFAEITPKVYARYFNERVSFLAAPVLNVVMMLLKPIIILVTYISNKILYLLGVDVSKIRRPMMTEEVIKTCIKMGSDEGSISAEEKRMLGRVFTLNDKTMGEVMVPKDKMTVLDIDASMQEILKTMKKTGYSRFPVKKGGGFDIVGFVHGKDVLYSQDTKRVTSLKSIMRPPYFVPVDRKIDAQLRSFQVRKLHQAVVLDNKGKAAGLITLEDILEELVGSIQDEYD